MKEVKHSDYADEMLELTNSWEERGMKKGKEEGIKEGKKAATRELALELLKEGSSVAFVAKVTRLSQKEIEELRKSL